MKEKVKKIIGNNFENSIGLILVINYCQSIVQGHSKWSLILLKKLDANKGDASSDGILIVLRNQV